MPHHILLLAVLAMSASLPELAANLQASDPAARRTAAETLCRMGEEAQPAAVALARAAADEDEETRQWASAGLEELGPPPAEDIPALVELITAANESEEAFAGDSAYWAVTLLGRLKAGGAPAVPALTLAASEHDATAVRERAVWALGQIGPAAASAAPLLQTLSSGTQPRMVRLAKSVLEQIQPTRE